VESVRRIRLERGWSQQDLADKSGVGQDTISGIESGRHEPRPSTLRKLARALEVEVADFFREPASPLAKAPREAGQPEEDAAEQTKGWRAWADEFIQQNEGLLEEDELVYVTAVKLYTRANSRLTKTNDARKAADAEEDFPLDEFNDIQVALHRLQAFTGRIRHELEERFPEQHRESVQEIQEEGVVGDDDAPAERSTSARQGE
jgi:transcriptional regulator with XRE-family HTH domain